MAKSKIEWTRYTWNRWYGCQKISPGCDRCYAATWGRRTGLLSEWGQQGQGAGLRQSARPNTINAPHKWNRLAQIRGVRYRVFALSLGDFFDNKADVQWRHDAWATINACQDLDWLILTKRPQNIKGMLPVDWRQHGPYPNVWLGATVENREEVSRRIEYLLDVPARVHWVSAEPLLEQIDLRNYLSPPTTQGINWVVGGGETGGRERMADPNWFRDLRDQCWDNGAAYFMKQMTKKMPIPADLEVRQYPDFTAPLGIRSSQ